MAGVGVTLLDEAGRRKRGRCLEDNLLCHKTGGQGVKVPIPPVQCRASLGRFCRLIMVTLDGLRVVAGGWSRRWRSLTGTPS